MSIKVEGIFLHKDYSNLITETFAKRFHVDLNHWIKPFGYYNQAEQSIICNRSLPDGVYVLLGSVSYPGKERMSCYTVYQFNICRSRGLDLSMYRPLNNYPNAPAIPLSPVFPLFKVGNISDYKKAKTVYEGVIKNYLSIDSLIRIINNLDPNTLESKIYRLRLALQRQIDKEK